MVQNNISSTQSIVNSLAQRQHAHYTPRCSSKPSSTSWLALTATTSAVKLSPRACGETAAKVCFGRDSGQDQKLNADDIEYAATFLRIMGEKEGMEAMYHMLTPDFACAEWLIEIPNGGDVLALAKHYNGRINSTVHFNDIANAIDGGGADSTAEMKKNSLADCGAAGGMTRVNTDPANPVYNTPEYKAAKVKPDGVLIKLVKKP